MLQNSLVGAVIAANINNGIVFESLISVKSYLNQ